MKRSVLSMSILSVAALTAAAQTPVKVQAFVYSTTNVMGKVTKGAPYSADEITETLQVLSDGTRISNQNQSTVYRDGEGRVRRESPEQITIWDPVANVSYTLDPKAMTAVKSTMKRPTGIRISPDNSVTAAYIPRAATPADQIPEPAQLVEQLQKLRAEAEATSVVINGAAAEPQAGENIKIQLATVEGQLKQLSTGAAKTESLGTQVMQGVTAEGTRETSTIQTGAIGNDRPINTVTESWYSSELQTNVMTKRTDPRTGEETFRLANVHRGEPGADLFMLPPGYQMVDNSLPMPRKVVVQPRKEE